MFKEVDMNHALQYFEEGMQLYDDAKFQTCIEFMQKAIPILQKEQAWLKLIKAQDTLACAYMLLGKLQEAHPILLQNVKNATQHLGEKHPSTSNAYNSLGYCYGEQGDFDLQLKYYQKSLEILLIEHGEIHPQIATSFNNIGYCYSQKGYYQKSMEYTQKAMKTRLQLYGELHPLTAQSYNNIGTCYNAEFGDTDKGLIYYQKALDIRLQILKPTHPSIGVSYGNLGTCYEKKGEYELALQYKQKALQIDLNNYGEEHPSVALNCNNIGYTYKLRGNLTKAMQYTKRGLDIRLKTLGKNHPLTAVSWMNVGLLFGEAKEYKLQVEYLQKALHHQQQIFGGHKHPSIGLTYMNLGKAFGKWKQPLNQLNHLQKALHNLIENYKEANIYHLPSLEGYNDSTLFLEALEEKGKAFKKLFHTFKQIKDLQASLAHFKAALKLLNQMRNSYKADGSKLLLAKKKQSLFEQTIDVSMTLFKHLNDATLLQSAFNACEQSKAALLLSNFKEIEAKAAANIPSELLEKEQF